MVANHLQATPQSVTSDTNAGTHSDLINNTTAVRTAVGRALRQKLRLSELPSFTIGFEVTDTEDVRSVSDIAAKFNISEEETHKIIEAGLLEIGGFNFRFAQMKGYFAVSGFSPADLELFDAKMRFLLQRSTSEDGERQLDRFIKVLELPSFAGAGMDYKFDMDKFLAIRETRECKEFRAWLHTIDSRTDSEIKDAVKGIRHKVGNLASHGVSKAMRFITTTGLGVAHPVLGATASALDTFVVEKLFPESGVAAFVSKLYGSVYRPM